jgi:hypothetical protein
MVEPQEAVNLRQWLDENILTATDTNTTIEDIFEAVFFMYSIRKSWKSAASDDGQC